MSQQITDRASDPPETLKITVHSESGASTYVFPQTITLTNSVYQVTWHRGALAPGARLQIRFLSRNEDGPFLSLESYEQLPGEVNGYGNRGPGDTLKEYDYEVRILQKGKTAKKIGDGHLVNNAKKIVLDPRGNGTDPPFDPPEYG